MTDKVLLVDDDPSLLRLVEHYLAAEGFDTVAAANGAQALACLKKDEPAVIVLDLLLPDVSGQELLAKFKKDWPAVPVVVLTAQTDFDQVVECMRLGAVDYVQKPFDATRLVTSIRNAGNQGRLEERVASLSSRLREKEGFASIIGKSSAIRRTIHLLERAAAGDVTVLLQGESGTGKEVAARAVHAESARHAGPFVAVNCGAIPEGLIESELFGHEKGAFTGAASARVGCFEQACGGTIFLDEIGELRADLQVRLLRVLQERQVQRVGSSTTVSIDVRVIAATNKDLKAEVAARDFREDLYYRLAVFPVVLPPLRERDGDVLLLARTFIERFASHDGKRVGGFTADAQSALERYPWPGNVRELKNVLERAVILEDGGCISVNSLADEIAAALDPAAYRTGISGVPGVVRSAAVEQPGERGGIPTRGAPASSSLVDPGVTHDGLNGAAAGSEAPSRPEDIVPLEEEERRIILRALELTRWNVQEASRRLGIGRATIYRKIERYGLKAAG